jgi:hypothetical protein
MVRAMTQRAPDGGLEQVRGSVWLLAGALALVALAIFLLLRPLLAPLRGDVSASAPNAPRAETGSAGGGSEQRAAAPPDGSDHRRARPVPRAERVPPAPAAAAGSEEAEATAPADDAVGEGSEPSGIALFPPPGTDPPKPGIVVPDGFELPPGYVRHHQVTDDGVQLAPILMFHPDFEWVDAAGNPIVLPEDHVVPPDLAPPGMPVQILDVPDTRIEIIAPPPGADLP